MPRRGRASPIYEALLAKPDTLLLLARDGDELVGYALAHVTAVQDTWVPDTWRTGPRIGELEFVGVVEGRRRGGRRQHADGRRRA